ncbi:hypothetical protein BGZ92_005479 [Podila epicladia]|nr:hypothetical protein BGZ92_005479 [Podila epicladia]
MGTQLYRSDGPACAMIIGGCPTAPGPGKLRTSFNISQSAPFAELMVSIQIVGSNQQTIVCAAVLLEQTMTSVNTAIGLLPLALAAYSGGISLAATIMRAAIGNGFLGAVATYGLASEAITVHTPGFFDIIFYTQFILMTGQLAINYPSFYSTFTALFHWSFLGFKDSLAGKGPANATFILAYGGAGSVNQINSPLNGSWLSSGISNNINHDNNNKRSMNDFHVSPLPAVAEYFIHDLRIIPSRSPLQRQQTTSNMSLWKRQAYEPSNSATNSPPTSPHTSPYTSSHESPQSPPPTSPPTTPTSSATKPSSSKSSRSMSQSPFSSMRPANDPGTPARASSTATSPSPTVIVDIPVSFTNISGSVPHNISRFGVEAYAAAIGAYPSKLFLGTLINAALAVVVSLVLSGILLVVAWVMAKGKHQKGKTLQHAANFITGGAAMIVVAAISILVISIGATIFFTWRVLHAAAKFLIFDDQATLLKYGTLYNTLTEEGTLFFLVTLLVRFLWGLVISMLSSFGIAQVAVLIVVELGYILVIAVKWPFSESSDNKFHLFLGVIRVVITGCGLAYIHDLQASPEVRQLFGYIQMALHLAVFIVVFALAIWNTIQVL